jgi:hypothetical protein
LIINERYVTDISAELSLVLYNIKYKTMIRPKSPFNGKRYLANTDTQEIHDLLKEKPGCRIDEIAREHVHMLDNYQEVMDLINTPHGDWIGCVHCLPGLETG